MSRVPTAPCKTLPHASRTHQLGCLAWSAGPEPLAFLLSLRFEGESGPSPSCPWTPVPPSSTTSEGRALSSIFQGKKNKRGRGRGRGQWAGPGGSPHPVPRLAAGSPREACVPASLAGLRGSRCGPPRDSRSGWAALGCPQERPVQPGMERSRPSCPSRVRPSALGFAPLAATSAASESARPRTPAGFLPRGPCASPRQPRAARLGAGEGLEEGAQGPGRCSCLCPGEGLQARRICRSAWVTDAQASVGLLCQGSLTACQEKLGVNREPRHRGPFRTLHSPAQLSRAPPGPRVLQATSTADRACPTSVLAALQGPRVSPTSARGLCSTC